ncbi:MAG: autotransporter outer membrane beta-barrel domain-containing protein [Planctomycetia bacterium]|nr:autotransporter outer membrane beta-barrel domain-containing protein [Planctomycetia bacterium]
MLKKETVNFHASSLVKTRHLVKWIIVCVFLLAFLVLITTVKAQETPPTTTTTTTTTTPDPEENSSIIHKKRKSDDTPTLYTHGEIYASEISFFYMNNFLRMQSLSEQLRRVPLVTFSEAASSEQVPVNPAAGAGYGTGYGAGYGGYDTGGMNSAPYGPGYAPIYGDPSMGYNGAPMESGIYRGQQTNYGDPGTLIYSAFAQVTGGKGKVSDRKGSLGYDTDQRGIMAGLDLFGCTDCRSGLFYSYDQDKIKKAPTYFGDLKAKDHTLGIYHYFGDEFVYNILTVRGNYGKWHTNRSIMTTQDLTSNMSSKLNHYSGGASFERGANFHLGDAFTITPLGAVDYTYLYRKGGTETYNNNDSLYALQIKKGNYHSLRSILGAKASLNMYPGSQELRLIAQGNWSHEFLSYIDGRTKMNFVGETNQFITYGNTMGRDWGLIGGGVEWIPFPQFVLYVNYDYMKNKYLSQHYGYGGVKWRW